MASSRALATARAVATRSAEELASPLPSGRLLWIFRRPPAGSPASSMIIEVRARAFFLCGGQTWSTSVPGSGSKRAMAQRATGRVTRKSPFSSGRTPWSSSPKVPKAVLTPVVTAPRPSREPIAPGATVADTAPAAPRPSSAVTGAVTGAGWTAGVSRSVVVVT